jgi:hypothetical protein
MNLPQYQLTGQLRSHPRLQKFQAFADQNGLSLLQVLVLLQDPDRGASFESLINRPDRKPINQPS